MCHARIAARYFLATLTEMSSYGIDDDTWRTELMEDSEGSETAHRPDE
jgi:hypothetical protein